MSNELGYMTSVERLEAFKMITSACSHIWGRDTKTKKRIFREEKAKEVLEKLAPLTLKDPYFLAHLTSYAIKKSQSKDLKVFLTYLSMLSDANGQPFKKGGKKNKPNLRSVGVAAIQELPPYLVSRVSQLMNMKWKSDDFSLAFHQPSTLRTAIRKYIQYREANPDYVRGAAKQFGGKKTYKKLYRSTHMSPSDEVASILNWNQKGKDIKAERLYDFSELEAVEIAETIRAQKLSPQQVFGELARVERHITQPVAVAVLEQATGNQVVLMTRMLEDQGLLVDDEVKKLYESKISEAKTTLDRAATVSKQASEATKTALKNARSKKRKEATVDIGKIFIHLDASPSMEQAIEVAKTKSAILAEMVNNPEENFDWGYFADVGYKLELPDGFTEEDFLEVFYGKSIMGQWGTNCFSLYEEARKFGADVDIFISDGCHNTGPLARHIEDFHKNNPDLYKPRAMVWVKVDGGHGTSELLKQEYLANNIPVADITPETLDDSALVVESIRNAMLGPIAKIDEIMETPLLELPDWYFAL